MSKEVLIKFDDEFYNSIKELADASDRKVTQEIRYLVKIGMMYECERSIGSSE